MLSSLAILPECFRRSFHRGHAPGRDCTPSLPVLRTTRSGHLARRRHRSLGALFFCTISVRNAVCCMLSERWFVVYASLRRRGAAELRGLGAPPPPPGSSSGVARGWSVVMRGVCVCVRAGVCVCVCVCVCVRVQLHPLRCRATPARVQELRPG